MGHKVWDYQGHQGHQDNAAHALDIRDAQTPTLSTCPSPHTLPSTRPFALSPFATFLKPPRAWMTGSGRRLLGRRLFNIGMQITCAMYMCMGHRVLHQTFSHGVCGENLSPHTTRTNPDDAPG